MVYKSFPSWRIDPVLTKNQCRAMPAENSVLFQAAKMVSCPVAAGSLASPEFRVFGKVQACWPPPRSVYRLAWQHVVLYGLMALVCARLAKRLCVRATPAMSFRLLCYWLVPRKLQQDFAVVAESLPSNKTPVKSIRITNASSLFRGFAPPPDRLRRRLKQALCGWSQLYVFCRKAQRC